VTEALRDVGLPDLEDFLERSCDTLSGGQRQRVAIARALVMSPQLLIADEICSMLDSSTQANILRMLKALQQKRGLSILFISHDEVMSRKIADRTFRMASGILTYEETQIHTVAV
jgi:peptide/nickel transport system ATP-binding protein